MIPQIPSWLIRIVVYLALVGCVALLAGAIRLVVYVLRHLSWS